MTRLSLNLSHLRFRTKISLGITALLVLFGLFLGTMTSTIAAESLRQESRKRGVAITRNLSYRAAEPLLAMDFLRLKNLVDDIRNRSENVNYVFLTDDQNNVLAHTFSGGFPIGLLKANTLGSNRPVHIELLRTDDELVYDCISPIAIDGRILGTVRLGLSRASVDKTIGKLFFTTFALTSGAVAIAFLLASWFARTVTRRIKILKDSAEEVIRGNLDIQTAPVLHGKCYESVPCNLPSCPARGDNRRRCWHLAGSFSRDFQNTENGQSCLDCPVYRANRGDEIQDLSEAFDFMAVTLKGYIEDIREAERLRSKQEQLLRTILNVTPDLVSLQDKDLVYRAVNKAFCGYFNRSEEEILGKTDFELLSAQQADHNFHEDQQILKTQNHLSKEIRVPGRQGMRWFHILKVPVYDGEKVEGLLLTARDITVIKQYQEQLIHSQKMEDLGRLAGGVAHEVNTPLGIILGYAQLILEDLEEEEHADQLMEDIRIIERQAKICRKIVSDLLGFSRSTESTMREVDLNESIVEVISLVGHTFGLNRVRIVQDLDLDIPPIEGDRERLKQVWMNLLNNAFDAIGEDGYIIIQTKLCSHRRRVVITIADTGPGISTRDMNKIFDPFFTTKSVGKGTGLGLSVSFGIIKDHNGRISAFSPVPPEFLKRGDHSLIAQGTGTVFLIELPLWQEELPEDMCEATLDLIT